MVETLTKAAKSQDAERAQEKKRQFKDAPLPVKALADESIPFPGLVGVSAMEPPFETHAAFLSDPRFSHPANNTRKAGLATELQQAYGNQYVQRLVESLNVQAKLTVGSPDDQYEKEADRVADVVTGASAPSIQRQAEEEEEEIQSKPIAEQITPLVQRQEEEPEEEEEEEEEEPIQTKLTNDIQVQRQAEEPEEEEEPIQTKKAGRKTPLISSSLQSRINSLKGGGQPLPESTRKYFEPRFGADFSQVQVHTDSKAVETAKSINAKAFTTGKDVVFGAGQYSPDTSTGRKLLAHELTHVVQQSKTGRGRGDRKAENGCLLNDKSVSGALQRQKTRVRLPPLYKNVPSIHTLISDAQSMLYAEEQLEALMKSVSEFIEYAISLSAGHVRSIAAYKDSAKAVENAIKKENADKFMNSMADAFLALYSLAQKIYPPQAGMMTDIIQWYRSMGAAATAGRKDSRTYLLNAQKKSVGVINSTMVGLQTLNLLMLKRDFRFIRIHMRHIGRKMIHLERALRGAWVYGGRYPPAEVNQLYLAISKASTKTITIQVQARKYEALAKAFGKAGGATLEKGTAGRRLFDRFYELSERRKLKAYTVTRSRTIDYRGWNPREKLYVFRTIEHYELERARKPLEKRPLKKLEGEALWVLKGWGQKLNYTYYTERPAHFTREGITKSGGLRVPLFLPWKWWLTTGFADFARRKMHLAHYEVAEVHKVKGSLVFLKKKRWQLGNIRTRGKKLIGLVD